MADTVAVNAPEALLVELLVGGVLGVFTATPVFYLSA